MLFESEPALPWPSSQCAVVALPRLASHFCDQTASHLQSCEKLLCRFLGRSFFSLISCVSWIATPVSTCDLDLAVRGSYFFAEPTGFLQSHYLIHFRPVMTPQALLFHELCKLLVVDRPILVKVNLLKSACQLLNAGPFVVA